eukprot:PhF_6_TR31863/c0_g1_i1/m.47276
MKPSGGRARNLSPLSRGPSAPSRRTSPHPSVPSSATNKESSPFESSRPVTAHSTVSGKSHTSVTNVTLKGFLAAHRIMSGRRIILPSQKSAQKVFPALERFLKSVNKEGKVLDLSYLSLEPTDYVALGSFVAERPALQEIVLSGNTVDSYAAQLLLTLTKENTNILNVVLQDAVIQQSHLIAIEDQLEKNRQWLKDNEERIGRIKRRQLRRQLEEELKFLMTEFFIHEQVERTHIQGEEQHVRVLLSKQKAAHYDDVVSELRRQKKWLQHLARIQKCLEDEKIKREDIRELLDVEEKNLYIAQCNDCYRIIQEEQESVRRMLKNLQREAWVTSKRTERARLGEEKGARVAVCSDESDGRQELETLMRTAWILLEQEAQAHYRDAFERETMRKDKEAFMEAQRKRAEEAAREKKEREEMLLQRQLQQLQAEQHRQRERVDQDYLMIRKQYMVEEEFLCKLALGAQKIVIDYLKIRDCMFLREKARSKEMLVKPNFKYSLNQTSLAVLCFHGNPRPVQVVENGEVELVMAPEWLDRIRENETQYREAFKIAKKEQLKAKDLYQRYKADKCSEKLDPKSESFKKRLEAREFMVTPAEPSLEDVIVLKTLEPDFLLSERLRIWGGKITVQTVTENEFDEKVKPYDALQIDTTWRTEPMTAVENARKTDLLLAAPSSTMGSRKSSIRKSAPSSPTSANLNMEGSFRGSLITEEEEESQEEIVVNNDVEYEPLTSFEVFLPEDGTVTVAELNRVLKSIGFQTILTAMKGTGPFERRIMVSLQLVVSNSGSVIMSEDGTSQRPSQLHTFSVQHGVSVVVTHQYIWIPKPLRTLSYEEGTNVDDFRLCQRVKTYDPPIIFAGKTASDRLFVQVNSGTDFASFYQGSILITFTNGYTIDDQIAFVNTNQVAWLVENSLFFKIGSEEIEVARVVKGKIVRTSAVPKTCTIENDSIELKLLAKKCDASWIRRILSRLRYVNISKDPVEGSRTITIGVRDAENRVCNVSVNVDFVAHDDPAELIIPNKKAFYRLSAATDMKEFRDLSLLYPRIAPQGRVEDDDTDRFLGGSATFSITSGAMHGDGLVMLATAMERKQSETPQVVNLSFTDIVVDAVNKHIEDDLAEFYRKPTLHIEGDHVIFENRIVANLVKGRAVSGTESPESLTGLTHEISIVFTEDGEASVTSAQEILRSIAFTSSSDRPPEGERTISICIQLGNTVPKPKVNGTVKPFKFDPDEWDDPMVEVVLMRVTPELIWVPSVYGTLEYREGAGVVRLAPFDFQLESVGCFENFVGAHLCVEIVDGYAATDDALGLRSTEELKLKPRKDDEGAKSTMSNPRVVDEKRGSTVSTPTLTTAQSKPSVKDRILNKVQTQVRETVQKRSQLLLDAMRELHRSTVCPKLVEKIDPSAKVKDLYLGVGNVHDPDATVFHSKNQLVVAFNGTVRRRDLLSILKNLTYCNSNKDPEVLEKKVRVVFHDGMQSGSQTLVRLQILSINDVTEIIPRNERTVFAECSASIQEFGCIPMWPVGDVKLEDPDTSYLDGGHMIVELSSGHTTGDALGIMSEEMQQQQWAIGKKLRLTDKALLTEFPLPKEQMMLVLDGNKIRIGGMTMATVSFPAVDKWGPSNNVRIDFLNNTPPLVSLDVAQYCLSCITYKNIGAKFIAGIRLYTVKVVDKSNPTPGKVRFAVECREGLIQSPLKTPNGLMFFENSSYRIGSEAPTPVIRKVLANIGEKDKPLTSGFARVTINNPNPKDSISIIDKAFQVMKEGKETVLFFGKEYIGKYKSTASAITVEFVYASKVRPKLMVDMLKNIGFKTAEETAGQRQLTVEISEGPGGDTTVMRVQMDVVETDVIRALSSSNFQK